MCIRDRFGPYENQSQSTSYIDEVDDDYWMTSKSKGTTVDEYNPQADSSLASSDAVLDRFANLMTKRMNTQTEDALSSLDKIDAESQIAFQDELDVADRQDDWDAKLFNFMTEVGGPGVVAYGLGRKNRFSGRGRIPIKSDIKNLALGRYRAPGTFMQADPVTQTFKNPSWDPSRTRIDQMSWTTINKPYEAKHRNLWDVQKANTYSGKYGTYTGATKAQIIKFENTINDAFNQPHSTRDPKSVRTPETVLKFDKDGNLSGMNVKEVQKHMKLGDTRSSTRRSALDLSLIHISEPTRPY